jgi:hypothetical protein
MTGRFSKKSLIFYVLFMVCYLGWIFLGIGYRADHLPFILLLGISYLLTEQTHRFFLSAVMLAMSWILLDSLRVFPSYLYNTVHIEEVYNFELQMFGIENAAGDCITPNTYLKSIANPMLDWITGFTYLMWTPIPFAFGIYLFFKDKSLLLRYSICFFTANLIGVIIYYAYPAAPPWYVDMYGFEKHLDIPGSAAGLLRFDELTGTTIFHDIYSKSFNVFGAIPSLHSAYPIVSVYYARKHGLKIGYILLIIFMILTWFSAVYSIHHYIVDVVLGIFCAIFAIALFEHIVLPSKAGNLIRKLTNYLNLN